jgi:uncharacterized protein
MLTVDNVQTARRERLIRGLDHWWFLGPGGIAKIYEHHLDGEGNLLPKAEQFLRAAGVYDIKPHTSYSLTVLTSTDCNLGCGYCFQNTAQDPTGGNRPPRIGHARLTSEVIGEILGFTAARMAGAELDRLSIMLFGGEPLLNFKGCRELLARAADYGLHSAQMISNGVLLTPLIARELGARRLKSVQVTFDGDLLDHDGIRVRRSGGGTFDVIVENLVKASEVSSLHWDLRVNVSHHSRSGIEALIDRLADRLDTRRCSLYLARVGDIGVGYENHLLHTGEMAGQFVGWYRRALSAGFRIPTPRAHDACQACSYRDGRWGAVVNPDGTLYSCWETSGKPGWEVGTVRDGYLSAADTGSRWVGCGYTNRYSDDDAALRRFADTVDAALLDSLSLLGQL